MFPRFSSPQGTSLLAQLKHACTSQRYVPAVLTNMHTHDLKCACCQLQGISCSPIAPFVDGPCALDCRGKWVLKEQGLLIPALPPAVCLPPVFVPTPHLTAFSLLYLHIMHIHGRCG